MEFKQLEVFMRLYEIKSFSQVAKDLNISQPTVTLHIKQLEEELDTPLFIRTTRELKYTPEAKKLYTMAGEILKNRDRVMYQFSEANRNSMNIGVSTIPASYILPEVLPDLKKILPGVRAIEGNSSDIIDKVAGSETDIGIVGMKTDNEQCTFEEIMDDEFVFIAPNNEYYEKLKKSNPTIKTLSNEPLILREEGSGVRKTIDNILNEANVISHEKNAVATMNSNEAIKMMVKKGFGTSFVSLLSVMGEIERNELIAIPFKKGKISRKIYIVYNKNIYKTEMIKKAVAVIREKVSKIIKNTENLTKSI